MLITELGYFALLAAFRIGDFAGGTTNYWRHE